MSEEKKPEVIETTTAALQTLDVRDASEQGLALMEKRVKNQKKMLAIAIGLTAPNQWTVFSGNGNESIYPTGGASDTILRRAFGLTWGEKEVTVEDTPDGRLATCKAWLMRGDEKLEHFTGYRFMGGFIKNEADLRKGAIENMKSVAVRDLLGLRFRTPKELQEMGLDVGKLERRVDFQTHEKDPSTITVPFGKSKGEPITDIEDKDLQWLAEAVKKSVEDPSKAKWKGKNQELLTALRDEYKRRHAPASGKSEEVDPAAKAAVEQLADEIGPPPMTEDEVRAAMEDAREPGEEG